MISPRKIKKAEKMKNVQLNKDVLSDQRSAITICELFWPQQHFITHLEIMQSIKTMILTSLRVTSFLK